MRQQRLVQPNKELPATANTHRGTAGRETKKSFDRQQLVQRAKSAGTMRQAAASWSRASPSGNEDDKGPKQQPATPTGEREALTARLDQSKRVAQHQPPKAAPHYRRAFPRPRCGARSSLGCALTAGKSEEHACASLRGGLLSAGAIDARRAMQRDGLPTYAACSVMDVGGWSRVTRRVREDGWLDARLGE
jgi:hypothetical protein